MTQDEFAAKLGVTFPTVNSWENNRGTPSSLAMEKIEGHPALLREDGDSPLIVHSSSFIAMNHAQSTMNKTADGIPPHPMRDGEECRFKVEGMLRSLLDSPSIPLREVSSSLLSKYFPEEEHRL